jgi:hypothetical protein
MPDYSQNVGYLLDLDSLLPQLEPTKYSTGFIFLKAIQHSDEHPQILKLLQWLIQLTDLERYVW